MAFEAGREKTGGRAPGVSNKEGTMLSLVKQVIEKKGLTGLESFADTYPADFWRIAAKLIPAVKEISGLNGEPLEYRPVDAPPRPKDYEEWLRARAQERSDPPQREKSLPSDRDIIPEIES